LYKGVKYNCRVLFYTGSIQSKNCLKFLIAKKTNSKLGIGGSWNPLLDGEDPTKDSTMIQTSM
jgi:hypothetical protein